MKFGADLYRDVTLFYQILYHMLLIVLKLISLHVYQKPNYFLPPLTGILSINFIRNGRLMWANNTLLHVAKYN